MEGGIARMDELIILDGLSTEFIEGLQQQYAQEFADQHEKWLERQEREARKYTWVRADELGPRDVICEPQYKGKKVLKYSITEVQPPRSRFDRQIVLVVNRTKMWRYDRGDQVMVLA